MSMLDRSAAEAAARSFLDDAAMDALVAAHPTLAYLPPQAEGDPYAATWMADDGPRREERETKAALVAYLRAALAQGGG